MITLPTPYERLHAIYGTLLGWARGAFQFRTDLVILLFLGVLAGLGSYEGSTLIDGVVLQEGTGDTYFEADIPRVYENMSNRWSDHYRTKVHPLFSLIGGTPVILLSKLLDVSKLLLIRFYIALVAGLWAMTLYVTIRLLGLRMLDSLVFSFLGMTTSAALFWFIVPETYSFGSLSILWAVMLVAASQYRRIPWWGYVGANVLTLGITVTNWSAGVLAAFSGNPWRKAVKICYHALILVILFWGIQKALYPTAGFFGVSEESRYILRKDSGGPARVAASFFYHSIVMPAVEVADKYHRPDWPVMLTQHSTPGSASVYGLVATVFWSFLLIMGGWTTLRTRVSARVRVLLWLILLSQLALHLLYGEETFLYALHFAPVLVLFAAISGTGRWRRVAVPLALLTSVLALVNNLGQLENVRAFYREHGSERHKVQAQMRFRPDNPWPRGAGHAILALPGSKETEKGYHEPGGSFSPAVGSFGVSFWVEDREGRLIETSDRVPIADIDQGFSFSSENAFAAIETRTRHYRARWEITDSMHSRLYFVPSAPDPLRYLLVIRSVGPAGGPIQSLEWNGEYLLINHRWEVRIDPPPLSVECGKEDSGSWIIKRDSQSRAADSEGWCYAKCELASQLPSSVTIRDRSSPTRSPQRLCRMKPPLKLDLPDRRFSASLEAQLAHLQMGLVEGETRPGDPTNYPLQWIRDGSYVVAAMARAGMVEEAKALCPALAQDDFFGGFGSEADGPGLSIWALEEVAARARDPEWDRFLWPHIRRKAKIIGDMLCNDHPLFMPFKGKIVPELLLKSRTNHPLCQGYGSLWPLLTAMPAKGGLIQGKMDNHFPLLFVNAVNYHGLLCASAMADRLGQGHDAIMWRSQADLLRKGWVKAYGLETYPNDRTFVCGLWPTRIAAPMRDRYRKDLENRWAASRGPDGAFLRKSRLYLFRSGGGSSVALPRCPGSRLEDPRVVLGPPGIAGSLHLVGGGGRDQQLQSVGEGAWLGGAEDRDATLLDRG